MVLTTDILTDASYLSTLEQDIITEMNRARTNPAGYADFIASIRNNIETPFEGPSVIDETIQVLRSTNPMSPLQPSRGMSLGAEDHLNDTGPQGLTSHTGTDGSSFTERIDRYGDWNIRAAENISYGKSTAQEIVLQLMIDDGVASRGHRNNILNPEYQFTGVAFGDHARWDKMAVITYAGSYEDDPNLPPISGEIKAIADNNTLNIFENLIAFATTGYENEQILDLSPNPDFTQLPLGTLAEFPGGVRAFDGNDTVSGSSESDIINGNRDNDIISGLDGNDILFGGRDSDRVSGNNGSDLLNGNIGNDTVEGGTGNDVIRGGRDHDNLNGGDGNDVLIGDFGTDILTGGNGRDTFVLRIDTAVGKQDASLADRITDFTPGDDQIAIAGDINLSQIGLIPSGANTLIQYTATGDFLAVVLNQTPATIQSNFFIASSGDAALALG